MRPRRDPVPRAKDAWVWLGGIFTLGILGAGVVAAALVLWENVDIRQLTPALAATPTVPPTPMPPPVGKHPPVAFEAVLLESERNAAYFTDSTYYTEELGRWRSLIEGSGGTVRTATGSVDLQATSPDELMVLPEAPCLSSGELAAVGAHVARGGSVVANWAVGVRNGSCAWRGWSTLLELTGAEAIRELPTRPALYLTVPAGVPLAPGLDPGARVELRPEPAIALRLPGARVYWSDWALNPAGDPEGADADAAISTTVTPEGGRVSWFGIRTRQGATPADSARADRLLTNGILWAAGVPLAAASPWPSAAQAALVFTIDVEGRAAYVNASDVAAMFVLERLPVTFYPVTRLVEGDDSLAATLIAAGEVGSQTVDHGRLAGLTYQDQATRLGRSWGDIEAWTGVGPAGLRPPEEAIDELTLRAWKQAGGRYVLASNEARSASPEVHDTRAGPVVLLPRLLKDDYTIIVRDGTLRSRGLAAAFLEGARKIRAIGGLAVIAGHTQIMVQGPRLDAVRAVADTARAQGDWWIARADHVADWWIARSGVELAWVPAEPPTRDGLRLAGTWDLLVTTSSETEIQDLWIDVVLPAMTDEVVPLVDGVSVDFLEESWGVRVRVGTLGPREARRITLATPATSAARGNG
jgi:peptidoglycan/xylan/chitin deacetylase (PgdA/CDA1 family)